MTPEQLQAVFPSLSADKAREILPGLEETCRRYDILTKKRVAAFLGQIGAESGAFRYTEEIASGDAYEGNASLGNTQPGDGRRFKGRGYIQLTGRINYRRAGNALGLDLEGNPTQAAKQPAAWLVSGWFWRQGSARGDLNRFADVATDPVTLSAADKQRWDSKRAQLAGQGKGVRAFDRTPRGFDLITLGVNGAFNSKAERDEIFDRAMQVLPENPITGGGVGGGLLLNLALVGGLYVAVQAIRGQPAFGVKF